MDEVSSSQHGLEEASLYSVTNLLNAALSCFPPSQDPSFLFSHCAASQDTFLLSHCAALAVFCAILRDVIHHLFGLVRVTSGFGYAGSFHCPFISNGYIIYIYLKLLQGVEVQDEDT